MDTPRGYDNMVMSMRDDSGIARSVRGYYRMRDAE